MWSKMLVMFITLGLSCFQASRCEPQIRSNKWDRPLSLQQDLLMSVDQRLIGLDSVRNAISRTEISIQSVLHRMDLIETRLQSIQNSFHHTVDAASTAVKSSEMKYELLHDQLTRKMDANFDRLNHRLNTLESRSEAVINKLQNQIEQLGKIENRQMFVGSEVMKVALDVEKVKELHVQQDERNNQTFQVILNHVKEAYMEHGVKKEHLNNITQQLNIFNTSRNDCYLQSDAPKLPEEGLKVIRTEISDETHKLSSKIHNMYNDLRRTLKDVEHMVKTGFDETNQTNQEFYNRLSEVLTEEQRNSESFMDVVMRSVLTNVGDLLNDLKRQVDSRFKELKVSQEKHSEPCHKIKSVVENSVALVLEKIYDTFINRTDKFSKQIIDMTELIKLYNKQLIQSATETNSLLVTMAEENSQDHKQLDISITDTAESYQDLQIQSQEISEILKENQGSIKEMKSILYILKNKQINCTSIQSNATHKCHAIQANYSNGVINILTKPANTDLSSLPDEGIKKLPLDTLNRSIGTTDFVAVIGESSGAHENEEDEEEEEGDEEEDGSFDGQEEMEPYDGKPVDLTQFLLAYIKVLHGHLTPNEFLADAIPGNPFDSFDEMIKFLQKASNVPRETIHDIEQLALEQSTKETTDSDSEIGRILKKLHQSKDIQNEDDP